MKISFTFSSLNSSSLREVGRPDCAVGALERRLRNNSSKSAFHVWVPIMMNLLISFVMPLRLCCKHVYMLSTLTIAVYGEGHACVQKYAQTALASAAVTQSA